MRLILIILLLTSCSGPRYVDFFPYHDDGKAKPKVVLLPINVIEEGDERLAQDIQEKIRLDAMDSGELFVVQESSSADFVVQVELLENEIVPSGGIKSCLPSHFQRTQIVRLRLRVTDVRDAPKVVLYEVIEKSCVLPNDDDPRWNLQNVYFQIANDAILRIEEVILWKR